MIIKTILYNFLPFLTLALSVFSITAKNPVISVTYLISTFVSAACFLLIIGIEFIGISYIIVYIGAIAVLFLFVIMMINIKMTDILEIGTQYTKTLPLALSIISLFSFVFTTSIPNFKLFSILTLPTIFNSSDVLWNITDHIEYISSVVTDRIDNSVFLIQNANEIAPQFAEMMMVQFLQIEAIGLHLYTYACILFITSSLILLLAMFAAIIISRKK